MSNQVARRDRAVAEMASVQHGIVTSDQLGQAGLSKKEIHGRARRGHLHPLHRGVYSVGHTALPSEARWIAAVLACASLTRQAFLSHRSAAALWGLLPAGEGAVEVTVLGYGGKAQRKGIRVHRSSTLDAGHTVNHRGIPTTTPARTIADLQREPRRLRLSQGQLRQAIRQAGVLGYALGVDAAWDGSRSELEGRFLALCRRHRLPAPKVNVTVGPFTVDFLWREQGLVVETDGFRFHGGRAAFEDDRQRDLRLRSHGLEVLRLTYRQVTHESRLVAQILRNRL